MTFLQYIIDLLASYLLVDFVEYWFFPLLALAFLSVVPSIFRAFFFWR